ncbi:MAG: hypothetical protein ACI94Y_004035 [Maribacter sp.]|jgi:hypothetical protein
MKTIIITTLLFFLFQISAQSQDLLPLKFSQEGEVSFYWGDTKMLADKNTFMLDTLVEIEDGLNVDSFIISKKTFTSADIKLSLSKCVSPDYHEFRGEGVGAYYVSIAFFDVDSNFIFGHNMISSNGFSIAGASHGLQATTLISSHRKEGELDCYTLTGEAEIAIHQVFLYDPKGTSNGGIPAIYFVSFRVFNLGAG